MTSEVFYVGMSMGFNSSACVYSNKKGLVAAISQERLNGEKNTKEIPIEAAVECCRIAGIDGVDKLVYSHYQKLTLEEIRRYVSDKYRSCLEGCKDIETFFYKAFYKAGLYIAYESKELGVERVDHHVAHRFAPYPFYGIDEEVVVITSDGFGDGISGTIAVNSLSEDGSVLMHVLSVVGMFESVALVYQFTTGCLGFKEHQHEGKITGLAAYGKPLYVDVYESMYDGDGKFRFDDVPDIYPGEEEAVKNSAIPDFRKFLRMKHKVYAAVQALINRGARREDIACSVQKFAEDRTINWIKSTMNSYDGSWQYPCYLSGGLFANVRINQKIKECGCFSEVMVAPPMGDEGTCVGAVYYQMLVDGFMKVNKNKSSVCIGTKMTEIESEFWWHEYCDKNEYDKNNFNFRRVGSDMELAKVVASLLADGKIVCLCRGRMEFGPRALCKRSVLYDCTDKQTNTWLNKQLGRTEFMPFAPACLKRHEDELFANMDGGRLSAQFMTMTFDCREEMKRNYPAAVHVDGTARPQVVSLATDPFMHDVLDLYERMTGKKALINTSFNLHNNPIIENVETAIDSWVVSSTDALVVDDCIIEWRA